MKFVKGQSGNPGGRPKGRGAPAELFDRIISAEHKDKLLEKARSMAYAGNETMLKFLISRFIPAELKENHITIGQLRGNLVEKAATIIEQVADGEVYAKEANEVMSMMSQQNKFIETQEILPRLEKIENDVLEKEKGKI